MKEGGGGRKTPIIYSLRLCIPIFFNKKYETVRNQKYIFFTCKKQLLVRKGVEARLGEVSSVIYKSGQGGSPKF